jgi:hypothetical protein
MLMTDAGIFRGAFMPPKPGENSGGGPTWALILIAAVLFTGPALGGQSIPAVGISPDPPLDSTAALLSTAALCEFSALSYPLQAEPSPAKVRLESGLLSVAANNSDLDEILRQIASLNGMTIDGQANGYRIYGVYGPGTPRDVIASLLLGSGNNFLMIGGGPEGSTQALFVTARSTTNPTAPVKENGAPEQEMDQGSFSDEGSADGEAAVPMRPENGVRTQRILERAERMRNSQANTPK